MADGCLFSELMGIFISLGVGLKGFACMRALRDLEAPFLESLLLSPAFESPPDLESEPPDLDSPEPPLALLSPPLAVPPPTEPESPCAFEASEAPAEPRLPDPESPPKLAGAVGGGGEGGVNAPPTVADGGGLVTLELLPSSAIAALASHAATRKLTAIFFPRFFTNGSP